MAEHCDLIVSICTNDEHGNNTGRVCAVQLADGALDLQWGELGSQPKYRIDGNSMYFSRRKFRIGPVTTWYGNWCWTGIAMDFSEVTRLLNYLATDDRWHNEGGWCDLCDAYSAGKVTQELLYEVEG